MSGRIAWLIKDVIDPKFITIQGGHFLWSLHQKKKTSFKLMKTTFLIFSSLSWIKTCFSIDAKAVFLYYPLSEQAIIGS